MADRFWVGGTGNFNNTAKWSTTSGGTGGASVPTSSDNAIFDTNSGTGVVTVNVNSACLSYTGVAAMQLNISASMNFDIYDSFTLVTGQLVGGSGTLRFFTTLGTSTLTTIAISLPWSVVLSHTGTLTLQDNLNLAGGAGTSLTITSGTFNTNSKTVTNVRTLIQGSGVKVLTMTNSTWIVTGTNGWGFSIASNFTLNSSGSVLKFTANSSTDTTFQGNNLTYGTLEVGTSGTGSVAMTGSNTFTTITATAGAVRRLKLTAGTTQTTTNFTFSGTAGNLNVITSSTSASHTLTKAGGGLIINDFLNLSWSTATPGSTWYAGNNSTNGGNNTNWSFTDGTIQKAINGSVPFVGTLSNSCKNLSGITRDASGNPLGSCTVRLISNTNPRQQVGKGTSDSNGNYSVNTAYANEVQVLLTKTGTPNVQGLSDFVTPQ